MYLFGAVCPASGDAVGYLMPTIDTFCMNLHLAEISQAIPPNAHVALLLDGAGWHVSKGLKLPANITLVPLPPYSPELNPMELAWLYIKSHYLSNRVFRDHEALYAAGTDGWNRFSQDRQTIQSVCHTAWAQSAQSN